MREIWKKSRMSYRITAILLTLIMVGTSLYFHFDGRYSVKADNIEIYKAYLPSGGDAHDYVSELGWQRINDEKPVGVGDRTFALIVKSENGALNSCQFEKSNNESTWINAETTDSVDGKYYYRIAIESNASYTIKVKYKETETSDEVTTDAIPAITWTDATTNTMTANFTHGDAVIPFAGTDVIIKKGDSLNVTITSASGYLTAFSVCGESVVGDYTNVQPDPQTLLYTYEYTKNYSLDDNIAALPYSISATTGLGDLPQLDCTYAYDATLPTIAAKLGDGTTYNVDYDETTVKWYGYADKNMTSARFNVTSGGATLDTDLHSLTVNGSGVEGFTADTVDNCEFTRALVEGTNEFPVVATDMAGNETEKAYTIKVDNTAPVIDDLQTSIDLDSAAYLTISGSASDKLSDGTTDGSGIDKVIIKINHANNTPFLENEFDVEADGSFSVDLTDFDDFDPNKLANGEYNENGYKIIVTARDNVGHISDQQNATFDLDATAPVINIATLERHTNGAAEDVWETVPAIDVDLASNTYYINNVTYDKVRYKLVINEDNLDSVVCKKINDELLEAFTAGTEPNVFYYEIPTSSALLSKTEALALKAVVTDKVGNKNADDNQLLLPKLQLVDKDIHVELVEVWCDGEKLADAESLGDIAADFNKTYTIKVKAKSGFTMTDMELRRGDETYSSIPLADIGDDVNTVGIHSTNSVEFVLPKSAGNDIFTNLKIYVRNDNNDSREVVIGDLLYDSTEPLVVNTDAEVNYSKWYQEYLLSYEILSGESAIESNLKRAQYSVEGQATVLTPEGVSQTGSIDIPESTSTAGTTVVFEAEDKATNTLSASNSTFVIKVDKTNPAVSELNVNGAEVTEGLVLAGSPVITSTVTDNLTIDNYAIVVKYNDEDDVYSFLPIVLEDKEVKEAYVNCELSKALGGKELKDGKYTVSLSANDMSRRASNTATASFIVDNTNPVLGATITGGMAAKNNGYYNTDVEVRLTCFDNNFDLGAMKVTDNGTPIVADWKVGNDMFYADVRISSEGLHSIMVEGNDKAGNAGEAKQISFVIDKTVPTVSLLTNGGQIYTESRGTLNLTGPLTLTASVSDTNEDIGDLKIQIIKTVPDAATVTSEYVSTENRTFSFSDEADYIVNIYAIDKANNQGPTRTISFRVDTAAPQITITGANGGVSASAATVAFSINEAFWSDAKGTVEIYRKAGDGAEEALYKTLNLTPNQRSYTLSEILAESGVYRFEFTAEDRVGHTATTSQKITVDRNKPEIKLSGVNNYDATDGSVSISTVISDEFYANKQVTVMGTRTDAQGKKTALTFSPFAAAANPTTLNDTFTEEGIYDITVTAKDIAGNVSTSSVHFTIDTSAPVIGDLSKYDGKTFREIDLDKIDLENLVSDLTVCEVRMYLNGSEYDGLEDIEDGSYTLLITAVDELGHTSEKSVTFVFDTKAPVFIVTGVEDGEVRNDNYSIDVSLQLDEDTLDEVRLNDKSITLKDNEASISVTEKGEYSLYMKAYDEAGNEAEQTITFICGEESTAETISDAVEKAANHWWMWAIVVAGVFALGGAIFLVLKKKG